MSKVDELRECRDECRYIRSSMEKRWILLNEEIGNFGRSILRLSVLARYMRSDLKLRLIYELLLLTGLWVYDWRQKGIRIMWHVESHGLHVTAYSRECLGPGRLCERRRFEGNGHVFEKMWRSARGEVMAGQAKVWQILLLDMRKQILPTVVAQPESQKSRAGRKDKIADGAVGASCFAKSIWQSSSGVIGFLHRPSTVVAGVSGISPKSSFELERDAVVAQLA